jgi:hypothetical protein
MPEKESPMPMPSQPTSPLSAFERMRAYPNQFMLVQVTVFMRIGRWTNVWDLLPGANMPPDSSGCVTQRSFKRMGLELEISHQYLEHPAPTTEKG